MQVIWEFSVLHVQFFKFQMFERKTEREKRKKSLQDKTGAQRLKDLDASEKERGVMTLAYTQT